MSILAFFGAVGGMKNFVGKYFGMVGGWFSAKFFGAKLANDMYLMKKKKKQTKKSKPNPTPTDDLEKDHNNDKNKLHIPENLNSGYLYERFKMSTRESLFDWIGKLFNWKSSINRLKLLGIS